MAWRMAGLWLDLCSCAMICGCTLGPAKPTQGWCSGGFLFDIEQGNSDGVDLGGTRAAFIVDLPGDFAGGNATARLYLDEGASSEQRRELEAIFTGKRGGSWAALSALVTKWLPTQTTRIEIEAGDNPTARVGDVGQVRLQRVTTATGRQATLTNPPALEGFLESVDLARSDGSRWADPEMRRWEAGGHGGVSAFSLSA
jgi:hypothetical protein